MSRMKSVTMGTLLMCLVVALPGYANIKQTVYDYRVGVFPDADSQLKEIVTANDPEGLYYYGLSHLYGYGVLQDINAGLDLLKKSGRVGYLPAQKYLAKYYLLIKDDPATAFDWFSLAAQQKDSEAQLFVTAAYLFGYGAKQDAGKARKAYIAAAVNGSAIAQYTLAMHFLETKNKNNHKLGLLWLKRSADQANVKAQLKLGELYYNGDKVNKNKSLALSWFEKSAASGNIEASTILATIEKNGHVADVNVAAFPKWEKITPEEAKEKASAWLLNSEEPTARFANYSLPGIFSDWHNDKALAERQYHQSPRMPEIDIKQLFSSDFQVVHPNTIAMTDIITFMRRHDDQRQSHRFSLPRYPIPAAQLIQKSLTKTIRQATLGNHLAQFQLAQYHHYGVVVERNMEQAISLYQKAALQGDMKAEYALGKIYLEGDGVDMDYDKALSWLKKSAFKGNSYAQLALGLVYETGVSDVTSTQKISKNLKLAWSMYRLSAVNEHPIGQMKLADFELSGRVDQPQTVAQMRAFHQDMIELYEGAVRYGVEQAELSLAYYYMDADDKEKQQWAYRVAKREAQWGDPRAIFLLAIALDRGVGTEQNRAQAIHFYSLSAEQGNPMADFILGSYYALGYGVSKDQQKAYRLLQSAAKTELPFALYNLAVLMQQQNPGSDFIPYLKKAIENNYVKAKMLSADYYMLHQEKENSLQHAAAIYQALAENGYSDAQLKLGYLYDQGIGFTINYQAAADFYQRSALQGNPFAQYFLARLYQQGKIRSQDLIQAKYWYEKSAAQNFLPAVEALGFIHDALLHDYLTAIQWYERAAAANSALSQYHLGLIYDDGKGVAIDNKKAYHWYQSAVKNGFTPAIYRLGYFYLNGLGVEPQPEQAFQLFQQASATNDRNAQFQLAIMYEKGIGTNKDLNMAHQFYQRSANQGHRLAQAVIKHIDNIKAQQAAAEAAALESVKEVSQDTAPATDNGPEESVSVSVEEANL